MRSTCITIDQHALAHNLTTLKSKLSTPTKIMAMVKADAYGHGIDNALAGLMHADAFGVAHIDEALQVQAVCQQLNQPKPIVLIEGAFGLKQWQHAIACDFGCVIHDQTQLEFALNCPAPKDSFTSTIWLKYNTGMNRLGFDAHHAKIAAKALHEAGYHLILTSHFACADDDTPMSDEQIKRFDALLDELRQTVSADIQGSICNSAGIFKFAHAHHDWVRAGISLYGASPFGDITAKQLGLLPVMTLSSAIMTTHTLKAGETVGYGALWTASQDSRIGIVSIGYGDGYPRVVKDAFVMVQTAQGNHKAPIIGRVAMDMLMIDLTHLPTACVDDAVVMWGDEPSIDKIAQCANTIGYELMCKVTRRPYVDVLAI